MTSLFSNTVSPAKDGASSLPRRSSALGKPPLRALYDLLVAPMEGVSPPPPKFKNKINTRSKNARVVRKGAAAASEDEV